MNKKTATIETRIKQLEDRVELKNLVDTFSVLADKKDVSNQLLLFTENATIESFSEGKSTGVLTGRKQIGEAFSNFLNLFEIVFHLNGQQTLTLEGDKASGISYCSVVLVGNENGKKMKTSLLVIYNDEYVRENEHWLIVKRKSNFALTEKTEIN